MSNKWSKEDKAVWENSEVMQELEARVLRNIKAVFDMQAVIDEKAGLGGKEAVDWGGFFRGLRESGTPPDQQAALVKEVVNTNAADDPAVGAFKYTAEDVPSLVALWNEVNELAHFDLDEGYLEYDNDLLPGDWSLRIGTHFRGKDNSVNRITMLVWYTRQRLNGLFAEEYKCNYWALQEMTQKFPECADIKLHAAQTLWNDWVSDKVRSSGANPAGFLVEVAAPAEEAALEAVPAESPARDQMEVVSELRRVLKNATDKGEYELAYRIERTIDELIEEEI